jgi:DNA-binding transcriptional MerR regulator
LARAAGTKVQTVRYYEQIGLLPAAARTEGGQRVYDARARDRLAFIRHARELGFGLGAIRDLLSLADRPDLDCAAADRIVQEHLDSVRERIARLRGLERELVRMVEQCAHGKIADCRVIEALADHGHPGCCGSVEEARPGAQPPLPR